MAAFKIVAFDLGAATGFCVAERGRQPVVGLIALSAMSLRRRLNQLHERLMDLLGPGAGASAAELWYEAPLPAGDRGLATAVALHAYAAVVDEMHGDRGIPVFSQHVGTIRKHVLSKGSFGAGDANKIAAKAWCRENGFPDYNDNIADAIVLAEYAANCSDWSLTEE